MTEEAETSLSDAALAAISANNENDAKTPYPAGFDVQTYKLSTAILRHWARIFKGNNSAWKLPEIVGLSLEKLADLTEGDRRVGACWSV